LLKKKDCAAVQKWKKSIVNKMFWCASSTDDDDHDLKEAKWLSITNHLMNRHSGHDNPLFPKCAYGRLHGRESKKKMAQARYIPQNYSISLSTSPSHYSPIYTCIFRSILLHVHSYLVCIMRFVSYK